MSDRNRKTRPARQLAGAFLLAALAGCGGAPPPAPDTGSGEAVRNFYEGLIQKDWVRAHDALHPDSRKRMGRQDFARAGENYHRKVGFPPEALHVRARQENGDGATAHVVLTGHAGGKEKRFKDAVTLRRSGDAWGVVLPESFGRPAR